MNPVFVAQLAPLLFACTTFKASQVNLDVEEGVSWQGMVFLK